jgi:hypothetical protein
MTSHSACADRGRTAWQKASGYNLRAKVEASIGRHKHVIGNTLRSRTDRTETTEVTIAAATGTGGNPPTVRPGRSERLASRTSPAASNHLPPRDDPTVDQSRPTGLARTPTEPLIEVRGWVADRRLCGIIEETGGRGHDATRIRNSCWGMSDGALCGWAGFRAGSTG